MAANPKVTRIFIMLGILLSATKTRQLKTAWQLTCWFSAKLDNFWGKMAAHLADKPCSCFEEGRKRSSVLSIPYINLNDVQHNNRVTGEIETLWVILYIKISEKAASHHEIKSVLQGNILYCC